MSAVEDALSSMNRSLFIRKPNSKFGLGKAAAAASSLILSLLSFVSDAPFELMLLVFEFRLFSKC